MATNKHKSIQRYFIQDTQGELYGTNALKGFTEPGAARKLALLTKLHPSRVFVMREVTTIKELTDVGDQNPN